MLSVFLHIFRCFGTKESMATLETVDSSLIAKIHSAVFLCGYHRKYETIIKQIIPSSIQQLVKKYTLPPYMIYGIGSAYFGQFGLGNRNHLRKYTFLQDCSYLCTNITSLHCLNGTFVIEHAFSNRTQLFYAGNNYSGKSIHTFTQHILPNNISSTKNKITVINYKSISGEQTFISVVNKSDDKQSLYTKCPQGRLSSHSEFDAEGDGWYKVRDFLGNKDTVIGIHSGQSMISGYHILFHTLAGNIWSVGNNSYGQCGRRGSTDRIGKVQFGSHDENIKIKAVATGTIHNLCIDDRNRVWAFGCNYYQRCGLNNHARKIEEPQLCEYVKDKKIVDICCGEVMSICLDDEGIVYGFGSLKLNGMVTGSAVVIDEFGEIIEIDCGYRHVVLLTKDNQIVTFGDNGYNQCSILNNSQQIKEPYILSKEEIGIAKTDTIARIIADADSTLIVMNAA